MLKKYKDAKPEHYNVRYMEKYIKDLQSKGCRLETVQQQQLDGDVLEYTKLVIPDSALGINMWGLLDFVAANSNYVIENLAAIKLRLERIERENAIRASIVMLTLKYNDINAIQVYGI